MTYPRAATIEYTDNTSTWDFFYSFDAIVAWAAKHGVTLSLDENRVPQVTEHPATVKRLTLD